MPGALEGDCRDTIANTLLRSCAKPATHTYD